MEEMKDTDELKFDYIGVQLWTNMSVLLSRYSSIRPDMSILFHLG